MTRSSRLFVRCFPHVPHVEQIYCGNLMFYCILTYWGVYVSEWDDEFVDECFWASKHKVHFTATTRGRWAYALWWLSLAFREKSAGLLFCAVSSVLQMTKNEQSWWDIWHSAYFLASHENEQSSRLSSLRCSVVLLCLAGCCYWSLLCGKVHVVKWFEASEPWNEWNHGSIDMFMQAAALG